MTDPLKLSDELKIQLYAHEHGLLDEDEIGRAIANMNALGISRDVCKRILHGRVRRHVASRAFQGPFEQPRFSGEFVQGVDPKSKEPISYPISTRLQHSITVATSGAGKTNLSRIEILSLILAGVDSVVAIDIRKSGYNCLAGIARKLGHPLNVVSGRKLKWNPLAIPEGVSLSAFIANLVDVLIVSLCIPPVARRLLYQCLIYMYETWGGPEQHEKNVGFPTLLDLRISVDSATHANRQSRESILNRLDPVLYSLRNVVGYHQGWSAEDICSHHVVLSLSDLSSDEQDLIVNTLLLHLFMSRMAKI